MRLTYIFFLFLFLISSFTISAQDKYRNGYIVTSNLDTLYGSFKSKTKFNSGSYLEFKTGSKFEIYKPEDINRFYINDPEEFFISRKVSVYINNEDPNYKGAKNTESHVFLSVITTGNANLYSFYDVNFKLHFYLEKDGYLNELYESSFIREYYVYGSKKTEIIKKKNYINILKATLIDCKDLENKLEKVNLTTDDLTDIVSLYNRCMLQTQFKSKSGLKSSKNYKIAPYVSYNASAWKFKSDYAIFSDYEKQAKTHLSVGFDIIFEMPYYPKLTFNTGATIIRNEFNNTNIIEMPSMNTTKKVKIRCDYLYIPISFNYNISKSKTKFFLSGGFFTCITLNRINKEIKTYDYSFGDQEIFTNYALRRQGVTGYEEDVRPIDLGLLIGMGTYIPINNNLDIIAGIRFNTGIGISTNVNVASYSRYFTLYTGIAF